MFPFLVARKHYIKICKPIVEHPLWLQLVKSSSLNDRRPEARGDASSRGQDGAINQFKNALEMFRQDLNNAPENLLQRHIGEFCVFVCYRKLVEKADFGSQGIVLCVCFLLKLNCNR